jgi:dTDP-D-glucose 4,6-dehydratase
MGTRAALDWAPQVELEDGLRRTIEWYRANQTMWESAVLNPSVH